MVLLSATIRLPALSKANAPVSPEANVLSHPVCSEFIDVAAACIRGHKQVLPRCAGANQNGRSETGYFADYLTRDAKFGIKFRFRLSVFHN